MTTKHALIIDDDAYNVYVMQCFLDQSSISYTTITDTATLPGVLQAHMQIDIVFLDLEMPKHDGYEVLKVLKRYLASQVPIVACTVHTTEINRARKHGFSGFVAKPLDMDRFPQQLNHILNGKAVWEAR